MKYLDIRWLHSNPEDPVRLLSELEIDGRELRKLEIFADGHVGFASEREQFGGARLSKEPLPSLDAINAQPEFKGTEIDREAFERLWRAHVPHAI